MKFSVVSSPSTDLVYTNFVYFNETDFAQLCGTIYRYVVVEGYMFIASALPDRQLAPGLIAISSKQRTFLKLQLDEKIDVHPVLFPYVLGLDGLHIDISLLQTGKVVDCVEINCEELAREMISIFKDQILVIGQCLVHKYREMNLQLEIRGITQFSNNNSASKQCNDSASKQQVRECNGGLFLERTTVIFTNADEQRVRLTCTSF